MLSDSLVSQILPVRKGRVFIIQNAKNEQRKLLSSFSLPLSLHFPSICPLWFKNMCLENFMNYGSPMNAKRHQRFYKADFLHIFTKILHILHTFYIFLLTM